MAKLNEPVGPATRYYGTPPKGPHLIVQVRPGEFTALPAAKDNEGKGALMGLVEDPLARDEFHRLVLASVHHKVLRFGCQCSPLCRVIYEYRLAPIKGKHPR